MTLSTTDIQMRSVVHISCPAYENLSLEQIFNFFSGYPPVMQYLPEPSELRKVPKAWTCNIGASVIGKYHLNPPAISDPPTVSPLVRRWRPAVHPPVATH